MSSLLSSYYWGKHCLLIFFIEKAIRFHFMSLKVIFFLSSLPLRNIKSMSVKNVTKIIMSLSPTPPQVSLPSSAILPLHFLLTFSSISFFLSFLTAFTCRFCKASQKTQPAKGYIKISYDEELESTRAEVFIVLQKKKKCQAHFLFCALLSSSSLSI